MSTLFLVSYVLLWALVFVLCVAVFALYHHFGQMYLNQERHRQGPATDLPLPETMLVDSTGTRVTVPSGERTLIAFLETDCRLCDELRPALSTFADSTRVIAVVGGDHDSIVDFTKGLSANVIRVADPRGTVTKQFSIGAFPFALLVDNAGIVRSKGIVNNAAGLESLTAQRAERVDASARTRELVR